MLVNKTYDDRKSFSSFGENGQKQRPRPLEATVSNGNIAWHGSCYRAPDSFGLEKGAAACGNVSPFQSSGTGPAPPANNGNVAAVSARSATPAANAASRGTAPRPAGGQAAPSARGGSLHEQPSHSERSVPNRSNSHTLPPSTTLFPVVRVSVVALQLHKAIRNDGRLPSRVL